MDEFMNPGVIPAYRVCNGALMYTSRAKIVNVTLGSTSLKTHPLGSSYCVLPCYNPDVAPLRIFRCPNSHTRGFDAIKLHTMHWGDLFRASLQPQAEFRSPTHFVVYCLTLQVYTRSHERLFILTNDGIFCAYHFTSRAAPRSKH